MTILLDHAQKEKEKLHEQNAEIQKQMMLDNLNDEQQRIVLKNAIDIEKNVPKSLKINWKLLRFKMRLGSGSFGDCFQGLLGSRLVAIKKMVRVCSKCI